MFATNGDQDEVKLSVYFQRREEEYERSEEAQTEESLTGATFYRRCRLEKFESFPSHNYMQITISHTKDDVAKLLETLYEMFRNTESVTPKNCTKKG